MALAKKIVNWEGGSDARYDIRGLQRLPDGTYTDGVHRYDSEGRDLTGRSANDREWTPGLPGARGGSGPGDMAGGGGGGAPIPGAGTYLFQQALAQQAWEQAQAELDKTRRQRQVAAGMGADWQVDPLLQYGMYHQLLSGQGYELDAAEANAMARGLQGAGLGRQAERALRYGHAVQNLGFKNQLQDWENEYQSGRARIAAEREAAMLQAQMLAMQNSYGDWGGYGYDGDGGDGGGGGADAPQRPVGIDYLRNQYASGTRGKPKPRPPAGAAGFGGGLAGALIAQRMAAQRQASTRNRYSQARGYVR